MPTLNDLFFLVGKCSGLYRKDCSVKLARTCWCTGSHANTTTRSINQFDWAIFLPIHLTKRSDNTASVQNVFGFSHRSGCRYIATDCSSHEFRKCAVKLADNFYRKPRKISIVSLPVLVLAFSRSGASNVYIDFHMTSISALKNGSRFVFTMPNSLLVAIGGSPVARTVLSLFSAFCNKSFRIPFWGSASGKFLVRQWTKGRQKVSVKAFWNHVWKLLISGFGASEQAGLWLVHVVSGDD